MDISKLTGMADLAGGPNMHKQAFRPDSSGCCAGGTLNNASGRGETENINIEFDILSIADALKTLS